jgi:hypothetical protein
MMKKRIMFGVRLGLALVAAWLAFHYMPKPLPELSRTEFLTEVREGRVHKVTVEDHDVIIGESTTRGAFRTAFKKSDTALLGELFELGVEVVYEESEPGLI